MKVNSTTRQSASEYRSRAERCERQAAKATDEGEKAHFVELARLYRKLAEKAAQLEAPDKNKAGE
jgi:hypothetical protein